MRILNPKEIESKVKLRKTKKAKLEECFTEAVKKAYEQKEIDLANFNKSEAEEILYYLEVCEEALSS